MERLRRSFARFVRAQPQEMWPLAWSFGYFFCLLCGYYILRPVRDEMAIQGGVHNLPWMMTGTFVTLLAVTPTIFTAVRSWARWFCRVGLVL